MPLEVRRVTVACGPRQSLEAQARAIRYDTLATVAKQVNAAVVLLAQHAQDQLETVLIALSRGAGLPGLSGMAPRFERMACAFSGLFCPCRGRKFARGLIGLATPTLMTPATKTLNSRETAFATRYCPR